MTPTEQDLQALKAFDDVIEKAEALKSLKDHPGWRIAEKALRQIRNDALERMLAGSTPGESDECRKGFAKCINYIFNTLQSIIYDGTVDLARKEELLSRMDDATITADENDATVMTRGRGGMVA